MSIVQAVARKSHKKVLGSKAGCPWLSGRKERRRFYEVEVGEQTLKRAYPFSVPWH